jgi:hypothetical protein
MKNKSKIQAGTVPMLRTSSLLDVILSRLGHGISNQNHDRGIKTPCRRVLWGWRAIK